VLAIASNFSRNFSEFSPFKNILPFNVLTKFAEVSKSAEQMALRSALNAEERFKSDFDSYF
jgi:hypothetical protein